MQSQSQSQQRQRQRQQRSRRLDAIGNISAGHSGRQPTRGRAVLRPVPSAPGRVGLRRIPLDHQEARRGKHRPLDSGVLYVPRPVRSRLAPARSSCGWWRAGHDGCAVLSIIFSTSAYGTIVYRCRRCSRGGGVRRGARTQQAT